VIQDPQGAFFIVWEPRNHFGATLVNAPGAFCWNELAAADLDTAPDFYTGLFGWSVEPFEGGPMRYLTIKNGSVTNGGMREKQPQEPPNWLVYFAVGDVDASVKHIGELGGSTIAGPFEMANARMAVVADPQGATFALYAGQLEP
jgi:predicted enzyme related to lactoylglutathione lyase